MVRFMLCFLYANTEARKKVWKIPASFFRLVAEGFAVVVFSIMQVNLKLQGNLRYFFLLTH